MKCSRILIPLFVLIVCITIGCGLEQGDPLAQISGTAKDSLTGALIDSAIFQINDTLSQHRIYSDSLGNYSLIAGFGDGPYTVICRKEGYLLKSRIVKCSKDAGYKVNNVDFQLAPLGGPPFRWVSIS